MAELIFFDFMVKHGRKCFSITTAPRNCPPECTDKNGRDFPLPCQLLSDWCASYLENDWAILLRSTDLLLVVKGADEEKKLREMLTITETKKTTEAGDVTYSAKFEASEYKSLAGDLGYVF